MKKTILAFALMIIGMCVTTDAFAQSGKEKVHTFNLIEQENAGRKLVLTINTTRKEIDFKENNQS